MLAGGEGLVATRVLLVLEEKAELDLLEVVLAEGASAHSHVLEAHSGRKPCFAMVFWPPLMVSRPC